MPADLVGAVATAALVVVALAVVLAAIAIFGLGRDARRLTTRAERLLGTVDSELPPTLAQLRRLTANLEQLSTELQPRLRRVDRLTDEAEATLAALRSSVEATEEVVRLPRTAVARVQRTIREVGEGLSDQAERVRRKG